MSRTFLTALALAATFAVARADDDATPSFKKKGDPDKKFWTAVGEAVVKTARTKPVKMELERMDFAEKTGKPNRKIVTLKMVWYGSASGKKFISDIKFDCDASDKDNWEVLTIDYTDSNPIPRIGSDKRIKELVRKLNR